MLFAVVLAASVACASGSSASKQAQLRFRQIASGFSDPVYVAEAPGEPNNLYVVERAGRIRVLTGGRVSHTFLDIRRLVGSSYVEQGLLSVAFHPDYARNHRFYVYYTDRNGDVRVAEYRSSGGRALTGTRRQLLYVNHPPPQNHDGGQLQFGPDGLLYAGTGDGGSGGDP